MLKNTKLGKDYYFDKPFLFRAKSSYQIGKGSTLGGTIPYGDTNNYAIIGMKIEKTFPWFSVSIKRKMKHVKLFEEYA